MSTEGTDTRCIRELKNGDDDALVEIWKKYFQRVTALARCRLGNLTQRSGDEEDVALSAFKSFWRGVKEDRFTELVDSDDLWQLLVVLTCRKAGNRHKYESAKCRDYRREQSLDQDDSVSSPLRDRVLSLELDPPALVAAEEKCQQLLDLLNEQQQEVVLRRLAGYTNEQIAEQTGKSLSTIERRARRIRRSWKDLLDQEP